jgi:periplasmic divalent cation tolerance protein
MSSRDQTGSDPFLLVFATCGNAADAERIASAVVEQRLAACVNALNGVMSTYRWQGRVVREQESMLLIKTTAERYPALEATLREMSSYELPEVIAVRVDAGLPGYLKWLADAVEQDSE